MPYELTSHCRSFLSFSSGAIPGTYWHLLVAIFVFFVSVLHRQVLLLRKLSCLYTTSSGLLSLNELQAPASVDVSNHGQIKTSG